MLRRSLVLLVLFGTASAFALNNRSAVSSTGLDTNPCSVASPCRSFGAAMAQTTPSGEIIALDSAGYGPFSIAGPVTISGAPGVHAAISVTSGTGISVNATTSDRIILRNLVLIGSGGDLGINFTLGGELRVLNCLVRGFNATAINASAGKLVVDHTSVLDQSQSFGAGIAVDDTPGAKNLMVTNSLIEGNDFGIYVGSSSSAMITSSTIAHGSYGVYISATSGTSIAAMATLESCTIAFEGTGVSVGAIGSGNTAAVYLSQNEIVYSSTGVLKGAASFAYTFNNNRLAGNSGDGSSLTSVVFK